MKRDCDCDTCGWYENGRCTHVNKNAYYPCPDWLRRFDTEKYACDKEYYGVAWNYEKNTYRATGMLENTTPQNAEEKMFVHNKIKKVGDDWFIPEFYVRQTHNPYTQEYIVEISDKKLEGFVSVENYITESPIQSVVPTLSKASLNKTKANILFHIEQMIRGVKGKDVGS